jgi:hypothetical protein
MIGCPHKVLAGRSLSGAQRAAFCLKRISGNHRAAIARRVRATAGDKRSQSRTRPVAPDHSHPSTLPKFITADVAEYTEMSVKWTGPKSSG